MNEAFVRPSPLVCVITTEGVARRRPIQPPPAAPWAAAEMKSWSRDVTQPAAGITHRRPGCRSRAFIAFGRKRCELASCAGTDE